MEIDQKVSIKLKVCWPPSARRLKGQEGNYKGGREVFWLSGGLANTEDGDSKRDHELSALPCHPKLW